MVVGKPVASSLPLVCVVVLNWNGGDTVPLCLRSLAATTYPVLHVVVVDNGSSDGSVQKISSPLTALGGTLLCNERNLGFTGGVAVGLGEALRRDAGYVFLLNDDAMVDPACIATLVAALQERPGVGLAGPRIVWDDRPDTLWSAGMSVSWATATVHAHRDEPSRAVDTIDPAARRLVQGLSGCALLVDRAVIDAIGSLDERYFAYYEDVDWCLRAREAGWRSLYVGDAVARHAGSVSANRGEDRSQSALVNYYGARNALLFMDTHAPPRLRPFTLFRLLLDLGAALARVIAGGVVLRRPGATERAKAIAAGIADWRSGHFGQRGGAL